MEPEGPSYNTLPKVPLHKGHHLTKLPKDVTVYADSRQEKMGARSRAWADAQLEEEHSFQRWSFQGVAVLGHLGAASDHGLMQRMLTLRSSLVTPMGVCRHKDGVRQRIRSAGVEGETSRKGEGWVQRTLDSFPQLRSFKKKGGKTTTWLSNSTFEYSSKRMKSRVSKTCLYHTPYSKQSY